MTWNARHLVILISCAGLLTVGSARPAFAEDGVVEINQSRALAGGVTPGDAPGFPVTISATGSYRLTGNLDVFAAPIPADATAISITASHVTLDLNGFTISGTTTCSGPPPACGPTGTGRGIDATEAVDVTVIGGGVYGMANDGIRLGDRSIVRHVTARGNAGAGIQVGDFGTLRENVASSNLDAGLSAGFGSVAINNASSSNGGTGLIVQNGSVVAGNAVSFNFTDGIAAADGCTLRGNSAYGNGGVGMSLAASTGFADNVLVENDDGTVLGGVPLDDNLCGSNTTCP
jgi:hypothetical protein